MVRLSVNLNKFATLRNARSRQAGAKGSGAPSVVEACEACLRCGVTGITVHPRADERHITVADVRELAALLQSRRASVEYNIEGDPRPDLVALVRDTRPHQYTLVPVLEGELTSQAGWPPNTDPGPLRAIVDELRERGVRTSVFVDAEPAAVRWAAALGAARVELFTEPYARAFEAGSRAAEASFAHFCEAAEQAAALGLEVNAGHDLDEHNLGLFRSLPHLAEVSIGHAIVARAVFEGLETVVRRYLAVLAG